MINPQLTRRRSDITIRQALALSLLAPAHATAHPDHSTTSGANLKQAVVTGNGDLYVQDWNVSSRVTKLKKRSAQNRN